MNTTSMVPEELVKLGGGRVLLVTDPGVVQAGLITLLEDSLKSNSLDYVLTKRETLCPRYSQGKSVRR